MTRSEPVTVEIGIFLEEDERRGRKKVKVTKDPAYIMAKDKVRWSCQEGPWAVHFETTSPFEGRVIRGEQGETKEREVRDPLSPGTYPYFVAVYVEEDGKVYTADPGLIDDGKEDPDQP